MNNWLLPEYLADALPHEAAQIERLRRTVLDLLRGQSYELVMPPLLEYLDALLTGSGSDLKLRTFKLVDQLSGRTLGVRADMTPQVARIDAHLLNRQGVTRLCYCDSVLHTLPASLGASREPVQLGVELYGYAGIEADVEVIRLMDNALRTAAAPALRIDISHVGVFRALVEAAALTPETELMLLELLQQKDIPGLRSVCAELAEPYRSAFLRLPELYGEVSILATALNELPKREPIRLAITALQHLHAALRDLPLSFDLADLRGYNYHNGIVFAAYHPLFPSAIAHGGRYDGVGKNFGRARPATGFSMDLREVARLSAKMPVRSVIFCPCVEKTPDLQNTLTELRAAGEIVRELLPNECVDVNEMCAARHLILRNGQWQIEPKHHS